MWDLDISVFFGDFEKSDEKSQCETEISQSEKISVQKSIKIKFWKILNHTDLLDQVFHREPHGLL